MAEVSRYTRDNEKFKARKQKIPWGKRESMIERDWPSVKTVDFHDLLKTEVDESGQKVPVGMLALLLRDICRLDLAITREGMGEASRNGAHWPMPNEKEFHDFLRKVSGEDYTDLPFRDAFALLSRDNTLRTASRKTGIGFGRLGYLRRGDDVPTLDEMRAIARAYGKDPSYFHEYRTDFIMAVVADALRDQPDQTAVLYRALRKVTT